MSSNWGPPGLETTAPRVNKAFLVVVALSAVTFVGVPWCQENLGSIDLMSGRRSCGAAPSEIRVWAFSHHTRRSDETVNLQKWIARHPRRINQQYGPFCVTPLHLAAEFGREDLAELLIAGGANVEAWNGRQETPLHTSATYGRPAVAKLLLARGADVNARDRGGKTPLHAATAGLGGESTVRARVEVAKLLLAARANVNARDPGGFTPLRAAMSSRHRNTEMLDLLFAYGADPRGAEERLPAHLR